MQINYELMKTIERTTQCGNEFFRRLSHLFFFSSSWSSSLIFLLCRPQRLPVLNIYVFQCYQSSIYTLVKVATQNLNYSKWQAVNKTLKVKLLIHTALLLFYPPKKYSNSTNNMVVKIM